MLWGWCFSFGDRSLALDRCYKESCSESVYDIMVLQDGKLNYFNSTYKGYVSISQKGFAANRSKWLEDEYLILTSLERECVAHVTLMMADSTLSPLPVHATTQAIEGSWNETDRKNVMTSHGYAGLYITVVVVVVVLLLLLFVLYKHKVIPCGRKKPEIQASGDGLL